jgi:FkbM family methyltransferase
MNTNQKILKKIKSILIFLGVKKLISKFIFFILSIILKSKISFLRGIVFDFYEEISKVIFHTNKYKENYCLLTNDKIISRQIYVDGEFDLKKLAKTIDFLNYSKKICNLYDIGANIGTVCVPAVKRNMVKKAFAVEPVYKNFELLKVNIILNELENKIQIYNYALSSEDDKNLNIELSHDNSGDHRVRLLENLKSNLFDEKNRSLEKVKSKKFDTLFKNLNHETDLVWIDTQGYEPLILSGAQNLINSKTSIVVEFWPYGLKRNNLWQDMRQIMKKFYYYADLSNNEMLSKKINDENLDDLFSDWEEEKGRKDLFTDILLHN